MIRFFRNVFGMLRTHYILYFQSYRCHLCSLEVGSLEFIDRPGRLHCGLLVVRRVDCDMEMRLWVLGQWRGTSNAKWSPHFGRELGNRKEAGGTQLGFNAEGQWKLFVPSWGEEGPVLMGPCGELSFRVSFFWPLYHVIFFSFHFPFLPTVSQQPYSGTLSK